MRLPVWSLLGCLLLAPLANAAEPFPPGLSPRGIHGGAILVGADAAWKDVVEPFVELTNAVEKPVVVLGSAGPQVDEIVEQLRTAKAKPTVLAPRSAAAEEIAAALRDAAGIWMVDAGASTDAALTKHLQAARERGALLVGRPHEVIVFCPDLALLEKEQDTPSGMVGMEVPAVATFVIHNRMLFNIGAEEVKLQLAKSPSRADRTIALPRGNGADYNELRRAAWGRTQAAYPSPQVGEPNVAKGALVIVGGGGMPKEIAERFFELGGGAEGRFVVLPTAMPDPLPPGNEAGFLERLGAKHVTVIKDREKAALESAENLAAFDNSTAIWFGGGRQWRFVDAYEGTAIYDRLHGVLARGGVIGGSSAGATIQGEYLVRGAPAGPHIMMCEGYERGFSFLPGVAIDQHFKQRNRFADMTALMKAYPQYLGIGLDEATAIVVQGSTAEVLGRGDVHFYNRRIETKGDEPDYQSFSAGKKYDLKERKEVE